MTRQLQLYSSNQVSPHVRPIQYPSAISKDTDILFVFCSRIGSVYGAVKGLSYLDTSLFARLQLFIQCYLKTVQSTMCQMSFLLEQHTSHILRFEIFDSLRDLAMPQKFERVINRFTTTNYFLNQRLTTGCNTFCLTKIVLQSTNISGDRCVFVTGSKQ
ncbi:Hypothetical_protein [Hexamita inflata]|uniref:Hypothetical_protein n=1 Tax=Hexamita inflata TaxID=28002 RepID=A0AA86PET9_9EUKA|nr:Hypothetical protein HINF_LOCUS24880 [Hexamita inflata]CAI9937236.1 Hypothetical protein HINF_LOCUS24881 [Hexamita inflata]CAI9937237.1 Hypothetical protein HINF_LOCUS24882 [Hexamita inflata]CAI9953946.1 Hypothetical protein HINF_LOCUS41591 [Hexamita inflata]